MNSLRSVARTRHVSCSSDDRSSSAASAWIASGPFLQAYSSEPDLVVPRAGRAPPRASPPSTRESSPGSHPHTAQHHLFLYLKPCVVSLCCARQTHAPGHAYGVVAATRSANTCSFMSPSPSFRDGLVCRVAVGCSGVRRALVAAFWRARARRRRALRYRFRPRSTRLLES